nr:hypothetical protein CFP56_52800 [Quercus suber]
MGFIAVLLYSWRARSAADVLQLEKAGRALLPPAVSSSYGRCKQTVPVPAEMTAIKSNTTNGVIVRLQSSRFIHDGIVRLQESLDNTYVLHSAGSRSRVLGTEVESSDTMTEASELLRSDDKERCLFTVVILMDRSIGIKLTLGIRLRSSDLLARDISSMNEVTQCDIGHQVNAYAMLCHPSSTHSDPRSETHTSAGSGQMTSWQYDFSCKAK